MCQKKWKFPEWAASRVKGKESHNTQQELIVHPHLFIMFIPKPRIDGSQIWFALASWTICFVIASFLPWLSLSVGVEITDTLLLTPCSNLMSSGVVLALTMRTVLGILHPAFDDQELPSHTPFTALLNSLLPLLLSHSLTEKILGQ